MSLKEFIVKNNFNTDKYDLGYVDTFYNNLFESRRYTAQNVLEIGVWQGQSILLWRDYFVNAQIVGVDINRCSSIENLKRIQATYTNAYSVNFVNSLPDKHFDIIIDDGPHTYESMVFFLVNYINKVKSGGLLILEDIIDRSWTPKLLELIDPNRGKITVYDMRHKQLTDVLFRKWSNGLDVIVVEMY